VQFAKYYKINSVVPHLQLLKCFCQFYGLETGSQTSYCSCSALDNRFMTLNQQNAQACTVGVRKCDFPKYSGPQGSFIRESDKCNTAYFCTQLSWCKRVRWL